MHFVCEEIKPRVELACFVSPNLHALALEGNSAATEITVFFQTYISAQRPSRHVKQLLSNNTRNNVTGVRENESHAVMNISRAQLLPGATGCTTAERGGKQPV